MRWLLVLAWVLAPALAFAAAPAIERTEIVGIAKTRESTILELLPRRPPAMFSDEEIAELERRINNLAVFDDVTVERRGAVLHIAVREKWTLVPTVDFSSGETLADAYAMLGLTEYNFLGTANQAEVKLSREQRGFGIAGRYEEHVFRRGRWSFGADGSFATARYRFEDGNGWRSTAGQTSVWFTSPPLGDFAQWMLALEYGREVIDDVQGTTQPPDSHTVRSYMGVMWNQFRWKDLVPRGVRGDVFVGTGMLVGTDRAQPRHSVESSAVAALPLGPTTVLMARVSAAAFTRGNPNFSLLLGSISGVRGLEDSLYRNWIQAFANVELRHSIRIAKRWALQGVVFADGAGFERMTATGDRGDVLGAFATGIGARVVPTWLAGIVLRADAARLFAPDQRWFYQLGLSQYF